MRLILPKKDSAPAPVETWKVTALQICTEHRQKLANGVFDLRGNNFSI